MKSQTLHPKIKDVDVLMDSLSISYLEKKYETLKTMLSYLHQTEIIMNNYDQTNLNINYNSEFNYMTFIVTLSNEILAGKKINASSLPKEIVKDIKTHIENSTGFE